MGSEGLFEYTCGLYSVLKLHMIKAFSGFKISAFIALVFALLVATHLYTTLQFNVVQFTVHAQTQEEVVAIVSDIAADGKSTELGRVSFLGGQSTTTQFVSSPYFNKPVRRLQVDLVPVDPSKATAVILHDLFLYTSYSRGEVYLNSQFINEKFEVGSRDKHSGNYYELEPGEIASYISQVTVIPTNPTFVILISLFIFVIVFCVVRYFDWRAIPAIRDMKLGPHISSENEFNTINGLRGLAALMVLFSHSAPDWENLQVGIGILFVISGYLLTKPFVLDAEKIFSWANVEIFWLKRIKRILPMYFVFVFLSYGLTFDFDALVRHFLFIQAGGHLWPMTQIFVFYMILPFVLFVTCLSAKISRFLPIVLLTLAVILWFVLFEDWQPFFNGQYFHTFYLYAFLMGVLAAYIQYGEIQRYFKATDTPSLGRQLLAWCGLIFTIAFILWSGPVQPPSFIEPYLSQFFVKCLACFLLIFLVVNTPNTFFNKLLANPILRSIGVIGFSFYLLHGFGISFYQEFSVQYLGHSEFAERTWWGVLGAFIVTYPLALLTYSYIERPFFGSRHSSN